MGETFVLLHGGIHGGWCYKLLAAELRCRGHEVYTPTLTGFGERSHLAAELPPATAHMFASRLPGCRFLEIDADHDLMLSAPVATADVLEAMAQP